jgi:hypothetical protein
MTADAKTVALFNAAVRFTLGDGQRVKFWLDPWLDGESLAALAPDLFKLCTMRKLTVSEALTNDKWIRHFKSNFTQPALNQFLSAHANIAGYTFAPWSSRFCHLEVDF